MFIVRDIFCKMCLLFIIFFQQMLRLATYLIFEKNLISCRGVYIFFFLGFIISNNPILHSYTIQEVEDQILLFFSLSFFLYLFWKILFFTYHIWLHKNQLKRKILLSRFTFYCQCHSIPNRFSNFRNENWLQVLLSQLESNV